LMISRTNATNKLFQKAELPVDWLTQSSYTILDTSEGSVFVHVNHEPFASNSQTGHVYISDWRGLLYSLSLPFNHRNAEGKCDFEKVEGLEGIYLANFIDNTGEEEEDVEEEQEKTETHEKKAPKHLKTISVITYDKGSTWNYLDAPKKDSNGNPIAPCSNCHLHLHGITDMYGPFYSTKTATGLIMGTGAVGPYLQAEGEINTFLSRDAGLTWAEVRKGSHIYEFGDHGGLIVMADDSKFSNSIFYSWDEGSTWTELQIAEEPFQIENIIIEPTSTSQVFIVYGWQDANGILVFVDFTGLHQRTCVRLIFFFFFNFEIIFIHEF